jgi:RNA polymerase sigma factor (TIGR02999 family)
MTGDGGGRGEEILPVLYRDLRALARRMMVKLPPGDTLQPTALVHEAYIRLAASRTKHWDGKAHFFGAAARAMRQILVDRARHKGSLKAGGHLTREDADVVDIPIAAPVEDVLALNEALAELERNDPRCARIVMYRFFAGCTVAEIAEMMHLSMRTVEREWTFAQRFLRVRLDDRST